MQRSDSRIRIDYYYNSVSFLCMIHGSTYFKVDVHAARGAMHVLERACIPAV